MPLIIVEDAAYSALRYDGEPFPTAALTTWRISSRLCARSIVAAFPRRCPRPAGRLDLRSRGPDLQIVPAQAGADLHTSSVNQFVMQHVAMSGFDAQVTAIRAVYRTRSDAMLAALKRYAPPDSH
ncbi:MAG: hypothetical protein MO852_06815 [Candidatus Devosia euplotis]|nr:hypothetical protein [Candidatus Devosia euplotis]